MNEKIEERLLDLLCKQAVSGLSEDESMEMSSLERDVETSDDLRSLELTAAAISTIGISKDDRLPDHLKAGILAQADEFFGDEAKKAEVPSSTASVAPTASIWSWLGWAAAAAASLLLIGNIWIGRNAEQSSVAADPSTPTSERPSLAQLRESLVSSGAALVKAEWSSGNIKDLGVTGDVVWSDEKQEGYMRFRGLPKNDPNKEQYQLWIFEDEKLEPHPKDGGVFDVNSDGEVIVPIDAKLAAKNAKAFAITVEKPGGVVVSKREKIPALAVVKPNQA